MPNVRASDLIPSNLTEHLGVTSISSFFLLSIATIKVFNAFSTLALVLVYMHDINYEYELCTRYTRKLILIMIMVALVYMCV